MIHIAKMVTNYPDFHGSGYYNFITAETKSEMDRKIADNSHDFRLDSEVKTRFATVENLLKKYPTKEALNEALFA